MTGLKWVLMRGIMSGQKWGEQLDRLMDKQ